MQIISSYIASSNLIEYKKFLNRSLWPIDENLTGTTSLNQSGPGNNGNEGVLLTPQISKSAASSSDAV